MNKYVPWQYIIIYTIGVFALAFTPFYFVYKMVGIAVMLILFLWALREH